MEEAQVIAQDGLMSVEYHFSWDDIDWSVD